MTKRLRLSLILICLLLTGLASDPLYAQFPQTIELGPHAGITTYQGDINPWKLFNQFDLCYGGLVRYNYDSRWSFRLDYTYATVKASDEKAGWRPERELNFQSKIHDVALIGEFNFMDFYTGKEDAFISPYLFAGFSWFKYKTAPYIEDANRLYEIAGVSPDDKENMKLFHEVWDSALASGSSFSIPFGIGCKLALSKHLAASLEWSMHYTFTDMLDGVTGVYPPNTTHRFFISELVSSGENGHPKLQFKVVDQVDPEAVQQGLYNTYYDLSDPTGKYRENQQRGDATTNDMFGMLSFTLTWKIPLPGNSACNVIKP